jgi:hypothetical protein
MPETQFNGRMEQYIPFLLATQKIYTFPANPNGNEEAAEAAVVKPRRMVLGYLPGPCLCG